MPHKGCREEGKAAKVMGLPDSVNPYRKAIYRLMFENREASSILYEQAAAWDCGFAWGSFKLTEG